MKIRRGVLVIFFVLLVLFLPKFSFDGVNEVSKVGKIVILK